MSLDSIAAGWRKQAEDLERMAKNYTRSCVKAKAAQYIVSARLLRSCATELEEYGNTIGQADPTPADAHHEASGEPTVAALAEERAEREAGTVRPAAEAA